MAVKTDKLFKLTSTFSRLNSGIINSAVSLWLSCEKVNIIFTLPTSHMQLLHLQLVFRKEYLISLKKGNT